MKLLENMIYILNLKATYITLKNGYLNKKAPKYFSFPTPHFSVGGGEKLKFFHQ